MNRQQAYACRERGSLIVNPSMAYEKVRCGLAAAFALTMAATAVPVHAEYPDKPVRVIVPFAAGGSTDVLARVFGQKLGQRLGQQFVIDNRAGAGGTLGTELAVNAPADGYTVVLGTTSTLAINESLYPRLAYKIERDLAPVTLLAKGPFVLLMTPALPVSSLKELIDYAKARPLTIASSGNGTSVHLSAELFKAMAGLPNLVHVPFKGGGPANVALMAGEVQMMINDLPPAIGPIRAGRLKAIAVADTKRAALLPEVPTFTEAGVPGYQSLSWFGLLVPAKTPAPVVNRLNAVAVEILRDAEVKERFAGLGVEPFGSTPAQLRDYAREETRKWGDVIRKANITLEESGR